MPEKKPPSHPEADWDPRGPDVMADQRSAYDTMRARCPVAHDGRGGWTLFRHADVVRVLHDHATFSNVVSAHPSVPNGMDPPVHTAYRRIVDRYFTGDLIAAFEPVCRRLAADLVHRACLWQDVELMDSLAQPFAARAQCAYLGWPQDLAARLIDWTRRNQAATLAGDRAALTDIAEELQAMVAGLVAARRAAPPPASPDLTDRLLSETVEDRPLTTAELTSVLRNWTMGEIGTIAAAIGIVAHALAEDVDLQYQLRHHLVLLPDAIDEILRIHGPLAGNRRVTTRRVDIGGCTLEAGSRVTLNWIAANRDPEVFSQPDMVRLDRDPAANLLYGAGIHVCPGAPLARLELRLVLEELLAATSLIEPLADQAATLAPPPASGYTTLPLRLVPA